MLRFSCIDEHLRFMIAVTPWNFIIMYDTLLEYIEVLLNDLKKGGISLDAFTGICSKDLRLIEQNKKKFKKDTYSYERISAIYQDKKKDIKPYDIWPHISLIACWSQAQFQPVCQEIRKLYNCQDIRDTGLISSEGSFSVPMLDNKEEGLLNLDCGFYEFIPEEDYNLYVDRNSVEYSSQIKTYLAHEIQSGKRYYMIITTYSGLFRHDQKDLIECTGHYKNIPLIRFISKVNNVSDMTGEKLTDLQISEACEYLLEKYSLTPFYMSVHPVCTGTETYYELLVPSGKLDKIDPVLFCNDFDEKMCDLNCIFREHIESSKIKPTRIVIKNQEFWDNLKGGRPSERYKHPYILRGKL